MFEIKGMPCTLVHILVAVFTDFETCAPGVLMVVSNLNEAHSGVDLMSAIHERPDIKNNVLRI